MKELLNKIKLLSKEYATNKEYEEFRIIASCFSMILDAIAKEMEQCLISSNNNNTKGCHKCNDFVKSIDHNYCSNCGRILSK